MGLESAEVMMDIEERWCIYFNETEVYRIATVRDLIKFVKDQLLITDHDKTLKALLEIRDEFSSSIDYELLRRENKWLPPQRKGILWYKTAVKTSGVILSVKWVCENKRNDDLVANSVIGILIERLNMKKAPNLTDKLVQDLGMG